MKGICEICWSYKEIAEHHLSYFYNITVYLCNNCHRSVHQNPSQDYEPIDNEFRVKKGVSLYSDPPTTKFFALYPPDTLYPHIFPYEGKDKENITTMLGYKMQLKKAKEELFLKGKELGLVRLKELQIEIEKLLRKLEIIKKGYNAKEPREWGEDLGDKINKLKEERTKILKRIKEGTIGERKRVLEVLNHIELFEEKIFKGWGD